VLRGEPPSPANPPSGCVFRTRCPSAIEACAGVVPVLETRGDPAHRVACIRHDIG
jgi:oligopeptide/dipeptide ABC transporter ATP-binding protein